MEFTFFKKNTAKRGVRRKLEFPVFYSEILEKRLVQAEKETRLFSLAIFKTDYQKNINVLKLTGVVLDFDNDETESDEYADPDLVANELDGYVWAYSTTHRHTLERPKFRVVIPLLNPVTPEDYPAVFAGVVDMLGNPAGLDLSSRDISRAYYVATCPADRQAIARAEIFEGDLLDAAQFISEGRSIAPLIEKRRYRNGNGNDKRGIGGRNEVCKAQVSAMWFKGKTEEQIVYEVDSYDQKHHNPPLFEDPTENCGRPGNPIEGARIFVRRIINSLRNSANAPKNEGDDRAANNVQTSTSSGVGSEQNSLRRDKQKTFPKKFLKECPGLAGEIARWIDETGPASMPALSLGAALCMMGTLKGHFVQTKTGLRTNIYGIGIAPSGSGKDHARKMVKLILRDTGFDGLEAGEPKSDSALLSLLRANQGKALIQWDEIGYAIGGMNNKFAGSHERKIIPTILKLFSSANTTFIGDEYANHDGKRNRSPIDQPCLSVWGTTVPDNFFSSIGGNVADGFLPRWLMFPCLKDPKEREPIFFENAPDEFVLAITEGRYLPSAVLELENSRNARPRGNFDRDTYIRPYIVEFEDDARELLNKFRETCSTRRRASTSDGIKAIWARGYEHAAKLALVVSDGDRIKKNCAGWACDLVEWQIQAALNSLESHGSENQHEATTKRVLRIIQENSNGISQGGLVKKTRWLSARERNRIIEDLEESESIQIEIIQNNRKGRPERRLLAIS